MSLIEFRLLARRFKFYARLSIVAIVAIIGISVVYRSRYSPSIRLFAIDKMSEYSVEEHRYFHYLKFIKLVQSQSASRHSESDQFAISKTNSIPDFDRRTETVHLAVVACGNQMEEPLLMLKSAVTFGKSSLHIHLFTDDHLWPKFAQSMEKWQAAVRWRRFRYTLYKVQFPVEDSEQWRNLFKICASQRLFFADVLPDIDALLYVDTDVLFLRPPEDLWKQFESFNPSQIAALTAESEIASSNWYTRFARHPFYKPLGLNSGVFLMNLTRMRAFKWSSYLAPTLATYRFNLTWGDQDIINIIFSEHPDMVYVLGCEWNYRPDHCMYMSNCEIAEKNGASLIHGSRGYFHSQKQPPFALVYEIMKQYKLGSDLKKNFYDKLAFALSGAKNSTCGKVSNIFLQQVLTYISNGADFKPVV